MAVVNLSDKDSSVTVHPSDSELELLFGGIFVAGFGANGATPPFSFQLKKSARRFSVLTDSITTMIDAIIPIIPPCGNKQERWK